MKSPATGDRRIRLERQAVDLSNRCPIEHSNPGSCPLFDLRPLSVRKRRLWIHRLTLEDLEYLVRYHASCAAEKIRATTGKRKVRV
jgi:hypothetical protein